MTPPKHPSLWVREAEALPPEPAALPSHADVVVLGGGIAGVATALYLARRGVDVVLLEADVIAGRASGRNDGQMLLGLGEHYNRIVGQFGADSARALWRYIQANHDRLQREIETLGIECEFVPAGGLRLAETEHEWTELTESAAMLHAEGIAHELLAPAALRAVLPGAVDFCGALRLPGEAVVQPAAMVRGLAVAAREAGAKLFEQSRVVGIAGDDGEREIALADGRRIRCTILAHCTSTLARELDPSGFLSRNVFPFRGQILASDPLPAELAAQFGPYAMSSNFCYEYFRLHGGRFVIGGMRWSVPGEEQGVLDDSSAHPQVTTNLIGYVQRHFPGLRDTRFPHVWTGIMAGTGDGLPLCGALPGQPGVFALLGFNGYGLSFACEAGATLAAQIVDGRAADATADMFAPRRFRE